MAAHNELGKAGEAAALEFLKKKGAPDSGLQL
jgi:hypothetical protein